MFVVLLPGVHDVVVELRLLGDGADRDGESKRLTAARLRNLRGFVLGAEAILDERDDNAKEASQQDGPEREYYGRPGRQHSEAKVGA